MLCIKMLKLWLAVWNCRRISCLCRAVAQQGLARTLLPAGVFCFLSRIIRKCSSRQRSSSWSDLVCSKGPEFRGDLQIHRSYTGWNDKVSKPKDKQVNCWSILPWRWISLAPLSADSGCDAASAGRIPSPCLWRSLTMLALPAAPVFCPA